MKRFIVTILEILICFVLQSSMFHYIALANVMPNMLLILVVSSAYMRGRMSGLLIGLFSGLLVDFSFGNVIGLYAIFYMLIGYFIGFVHKYYANDDFTLPIILVGISSLAYGFFYYTFEFLLRGRLDFLYYFRRLILPEIIYTAVFSVLLYKILHMINNRINQKLNEEG